MLSFIKFVKKQGLGKLVLDTEFEYDFDLIALVSPVKDYRLCWLINKHLNIDLCRNEDLEINLTREKKLAYFSLYSYYDNLDKLSVFLLNNKFNNDYLLPELKQADFLLMIKGGLADIEKDRYVSAIKAIPVVQTLFEINPYSLKSKQNLIFDESDI